MGYLSIPLNDEARKILTIIMPFGAFECLTLPMGVMLVLDLFQAQMVHLFAEMGEWWPFPYVDYILHFKGSSFEEHMTILDEILWLIGKSGIQVSTRKSQFCQESVEYLRFQLHRTGYPPLPLWISVIVHINQPTNLKQIQKSWGMALWKSSVEHTSILLASNTSLHTTREVNRSYIDQLLNFIHKFWEDILCSFYRF